MAMMQGPPPRLPNGLFGPDAVPKLPRHGRKPQDGRSYQFGDPGQVLGNVASISSTFGTATGGQEECTFIGSEGLAHATRQGMQVLRFEHAPWVIVKPITIRLAEPGLSPSAWVFLDPQFVPLFQFTDLGLGMFFGMHAETAFTVFHMPRAKDAIARGGLRFWTGPQCWIELATDYVEVQQLGRRDRVPAKDITFGMEDNAFELVLRAPQFFEARFLIGEIPNRMMLQMGLIQLGAKMI
jgi:hypothetical protein